MEHLAKCVGVFLWVVSVVAEPMYLNDDGSPVESRTVCGANDMENMIDLDEQMKAMGTPIGNLRGGGLSCTGVMISSDIFLTARHCNVGCANTKVTFGYLSREKETFACKETLAIGNSNNNQDYMAMRLEGAPGVKWGYYDISDKPVPFGKNLLMIHHPGGAPMKVSRKNCKFMGEWNGLISHSCDTNPGSSGSAVLIPDYQKPENSRVIAVHVLGGCNASSTNYNKGPSIRHIARLSSLLKSMVKN